MRRPDLSPMTRLCFAYVWCFSFNCLGMMRFQHSRFLSRHGLRHLYILSTDFLGRSCDFEPKFMLWLSFSQKFRNFPLPESHTLADFSWVYLCFVYFMRFFRFVHFVWCVYSQLKYFVLALRHSDAVAPRKAFQTRNCFICPLVVCAFTSELVNFFIRISWKFQF